MAEVSQLPDDAAAGDVLPIGNVCRRELPLRAPFDEITRVVDSERHGQTDRSPRPPIDLHQYQAIIRRFLVLDHRDAFESDLSDQTTAEGNHFCIERDGSSATAGRAGTRWLVVEKPEDMGITDHSQEEINYHCIC